MAQNVIINNVQYNDVPYVEIPLVSDPTQNAEFYDTSDATLSGGNQMLQGVSAYADGVKYIGTIAPKSSSDLTINGATVTAPAGFYSDSASATVPNGSATAPASITDTSATVTAGSNTITLSKNVSVTPDVSAGYISSGTAGTSSVSLTASVTTKAAATFTPTTSNQTIAADTYLSGIQTILGDANLIASNIKSGISIFGVAGSLSSATVSQDGTTKVLSIS